ncbi:iron ABC transporter permease [Nisaea sp.]|uniref:FecCD family ABC transporter permease n=1 Tax=Nisaea sp. TaxID=2024842 RepID=UPI0032671FCF
MKLAPALFLGAAVTAALAFLSVLFGTTPISPVDVFTAIGDAMSSDDRPSSPLERVVVDLRLPRVVVAVCAGAGLGMVGAMLQTVTRNDLADPFLFGLSSGAAAGAVLVITTTGDRLGFWTLPLAAFAGGILAALIVVTLLRQLGTHAPEKLILAGLAVSFVFSAITNYLIFAGDQRAAHSILFWSLGGLGLSRWETVPLTVLGLMSLIAFAFARHRHLDALLGGNDTARSLGIEIESLHLRIILVCSFATAIFVSVTGVIGFLGLVVPHIARAIGGPLHLPCLSLSAVTGAAMLLASDVLARVLLAPQELPVGIVTTAIGAAFVALLLLKARR